MLHIALPYKEILSTVKVTKSQKVLTTHNPTMTSLDPMLRTIRMYDVLRMRNIYVTVYCACLLLKAEYVLYLWNAKRRRHLKRPVKCQLMNR